MQVRCGWAKGGLKAGLKGCPGGAADYIAPPATDFSRSAQELADADHV